MNRDLNKIHLPSFALGFISCIMLYVMRPGLYMIFNGMINFLKFTLLLSVCGMMLYFIFRSVINGESLNLKENPVVKKKVEETVNVQGGIKYFQIPVTKLTDETVLASSRRNTMHQTNHSTTIEVENLMDEDIPDINEKTIRYNNFVNMAAENK